MSETIEPTGAVQGEVTSPVTPPVTPPTTVIDEPDDGKTVAAPADWPEDWREKMAGEDKAFLNTLKRYASPMTAARAGFEAQQRIRSGELKKPLGPDAKPEEIAAFRQENGIPEKPEGYEIKLSEGMVPGEADKPFIDAFKGFVHGKNWTPDQFNELMNWYYTQQDAISVQQFGADKMGKEQAQEVLREEWGADYRANLNAIRNFGDSAPPGVLVAMMNARAPDGSILGNNPEFLRWMASLAREAMPGAGLVPVGTSDPAAAVETEIESIQRMMREKNSEYWRDTKTQARLRDLLAAKERAGQHR